MPTTNPRRAVVVLLAAGLLVAAGCGDGRKATYPVRGEVFDAKKQPAAGAMVTFHPVTPDPKDPARPTGTVDDQGNFTLTTYAAGDGAPEGEYVITVVWPPARKTPFDPAGGDKLGGKLDRPEKSPHKFKVEKTADQKAPPITLP